MRKIKIVILGSLRHRLDFKKLEKYKSKFFKITSIETKSSMPKSSNESNYLNIEYSKEDIEILMKPISLNKSDLIIGVMNYPYDDNYYLHNTGENKLCLSIADIDLLLLNENISIENFIIKNIYEILVFKDLNILGTEKEYQIIHLDTRKCLFDMNGDKFDVIYNTESPTLCNDCKAYLNRNSLPENYIKNLEKELLKINKPKIVSIELFIKKYPLLSVLITILFSIIINLLSNLIWKLFE